jgi:hypothetical protein
VTFISPSYAITAAHCVRSIDLPNPTTDTFTVEQYKLNAGPFTLLFAAQLQNRFPNYAVQTPLTSEVGYDVTSYTQCKVQRRCSTFYGRYNCDASLEADVALIMCPGRAKGAWLTVAASDAETGPVEMYWPHEVLNVSVTEPVAPGAGATPAEVAKYQDELDRFQHYTMYDHGQAQNYHYFGGGRNQLLPLASSPWPDGTPRTRLGANGGNYTATDLFACHGTSGSGVLQAGASGSLELLGPMALGGAWNSRLCTDPGTFKKGVSNAQYTRNELVRRAIAPDERTIMLDRLLPILLGGQL